MSWKVDSEKSSVEFLIRHLMVSTHRGRFTSFEGAIDIDEENPQASSVSGTVDVKSLRTGIRPRDKNVLSASRFDPKNFPKMSFRSTRIGTFDGDNFKVYGELTIKDITREVVFDVVNKGEMPATGGERRWAFSASIDLNRRDYGIEWNALVELGNFLLADELRGVMEIQVVQE